MRWQSALLRDHPLVGRIWDAKLERFTSHESLVAALAEASYALLGEVHDNADHHAIRAGLLDALAATGVRRGIVFEQFDREFDPALQRLLKSGRPGVEDVANAVQFDRKGWNWDFYRPLVEIALSHGWPIAAGNLSRKDGARIAREGSSALDPASSAVLRLEAGWSDDRERALRAIIADGHCGMLPERALPSMALAQRVRDATLAEAMRVLRRSGAILIAGNGHVRRDLGVPAYLPAAAKACAVGLLEVQDGREDPTAYVAPAAARVVPFDFVYFTPRQDRSDPCLAFKAPPQGAPESR